MDRFLSLQQKNIQNSKAMSLERERKEKKRNQISGSDSDRLASTEVE